MLQGSGNLGTSIYKISRKHLAYKKHNGGASEVVKTIVSGDELRIYVYEQEKKSRRLFWCFKVKSNKSSDTALRNKWSHIFSERLVMWKQCF